MMKWLVRKKYMIVWSLLLVTMASLTVLAQPPWRGNRRNRGSSSGDRKGIPVWEIEPRYTKDHFTFARVQYNWSGEVEAGDGTQTSPIAISISLFDCSN